MRKQPPWKTAYDYFLEHKIQTGLSLLFTLGLLGVVTHFLGTSLVHVYPVLLGIFLLNPVSTAKKFKGDLIACVLYESVLVLPPFLFVLYQTTQVETYAGALLIIPIALLAFTFLGEMTRNVSLVGTLLLIPTVLTNGFLPLEALPDYITWFTSINPLFFATSGLATALNGSGYMSYGAALLRLVLVTGGLGVLYVLVKDTIRTAPKKKKK